MVNFLGFFSQKDIYTYMFFPTLLRYNWLKEFYKFKVYKMLFDTFINCNINYIYKFINYSVALAVKKPPANPGDLRDMGSSLGREDPLEKSMATHSRILACRIPWTEEPKGLQSIVMQRVRYDESD